MKNFDTVIIGAGYTGLSAAYDLASSGLSVCVLEQDDDIGGLAGTFEYTPGRRVEKFYHHWFSSDTAILSLLEEMGLGERIKFINSNTGLYYANSKFRLASPLDLLRFTPLPLFDRIRTGLMALRARRIEDWRDLENISAEEWIIKTGGKTAFEIIWKPLLVGKFGIEAANVSAVWFWNKLKLRGSSRNKKGSEQLAYFDGGFGAVTTELRRALEKRGVVIKTGTSVEQIVSENGRVQGIKANGEFIAARSVLATVPLPVFLDMTPNLPKDYVEQCRKIRFLGNICWVLRLKRSLSDTYWLNVADPTFPFVGVIEHTNFDDPANYGNDRIAYVSKYLPTSEAMFQMTDSELFEYCLPFLKRIFPEFSRDWVSGCSIWRATYSQPVITKNYSKLIPDMQSPIENLWLSNMAQIYPEDRGTNYAVKYGREVAARMISSLAAKTGSSLNSAQQSAVGAI